MSSTRALKWPRNTYTVRVQTGRAGRSRCTSSTNVMGSISPSLSLSRLNSTGHEKSNYAGRSQSQRSSELKGSSTVTQKNRPANQLLGNQQQRPHFSAVPSLEKYVKKSRRQNSRPRTTETFWKVRIKLNTRRRTVNGLTNRAEPMFSQTALAPVLT